MTKQYRKFLSEQGISSTECNELSNLATQQVSTLVSKLNMFNTFSSTITLDGEKLEDVTPNPFPSPTELADISKEIGEYEGLVAFFREAVKAKDEWLNELRNSSFVYSRAIPTPVVIERPVLVPNVTEEWGWEQLSEQQLAEYLTQNSIAAAYGRPIHPDTKREMLTKASGIIHDARKNLDLIRPLEKFEWETNKTVPRINVKHHTQAELLEQHVEHANRHRIAEKAVNRISGIVKELVAAENTRINDINAAAHKEYADKQRVLSKEHNENYQEWYNACQAEHLTFIQQREAELKRVGSLKINVPNGMTTLQVVIEKLKPQNDK